MFWVIIFCGICLIIDGVSSFIYFRKQRTTFQLVRVGRAFIGCIIIVNLLTRM